MFDFHTNDYNKETLDYWVDKELKKAYYLYRLKSFKQNEKVSDIRLQESEYDGE